MSASVRQPPPRRLPPRVYWLRRGLLMLVVMVLVWGVTALVGGTGDDPRDTAVAQDEAPSTSPSLPPPTAAKTRPGSPAPAQSSAEPGREEFGATRPRIVTAALSVADGGCMAADVTITPAVAGRPRSGSDVAVALSVTTAGKGPCRLELGPEMLALRVSTGGQPVWDTEQCPGAVPERTIVLRPGWTTAVTVTWPGLYGDKSCTGTTRDAPPGAYAVDAAVYAGEPGRADFDLQPPVATEPEGDDEGEGSSGGRPSQPDDGPDDGTAPDSVGPDQDAGAVAGQA